MRVFGRSESQIARWVKAIARAAGLAELGVLQRPQRARRHGKAHGPERRPHPRDRTPGPLEAGRRHGRLLHPRRVRRVGATLPLRGYNQYRSDKNRRADSSIELARQSSWISCVKRRELVQTAIDLFRSGLYSSVDEVQQLLGVRAFVEAYIRGPLVCISYLRHQLADNWNRTHCADKPVPMLQDSVARFALPICPASAHSTLCRMTLNAVRRSSGVTPSSDEAVCRSNQRDTASCSLERRSSTGRSVSYPSSPIIKRSESALTRVQCSLG